MKREFRITPNAVVRAKPDAPGIEGYAAVFNQLSEDLGGFRETIMPGAFRDCLATKPDVRALVNHDANLVLGRTTAKTLALDEDDTGLRFSCNLPDTQAARDLLTSIKRGDISQCSFGFYVRKQKFAEEDDGEGNSSLIRELHAVDLFDVSAVTFPAYPQTSLDVRSLWPDGIPASLARMRALRQDDDGDQNANGCECDCTDCQDDNDEGCTNLACDDPDCEENGCPNQEQSPEQNDRSWPAGIRAAVAFKKTPAVDGGTWDGDTATNRLAKWASSDGSGDKDTVNWSKYAQGFAWYDPAAKDNFGSYKLPHHDVRDGKLVSVWGGVKAAMTALLGGRGGTSIPDSERRGVYNHLAKEYGLHDKDVPDFHARALVAPEEIDRMRMRLELSLRA